MYKVMTIRRFVRDQDDRDWAELANIHQAEFHKSMQNPEFDDAGMYIAQTGKNAVGIADAHIHTSPSCPAFCVLRDFHVRADSWDAVAPLLLDTAMTSFIERDAKAVEVCSPEEAKRYISLLESRGFETKSVDCRIKHELKHVPLVESPRLCFKTYSEIPDPAMIEKLQNSIFDGLIGRPVTKEEITFWMKNLDFECFVGYYDGEPAASSFCETKVAKTEKHGWIYGLGVLPIHRRLKIGTALAYRVLNRLKIRGATSAFMETDYGGYEQRFYESIGFRVEGKVVCLQKKMQKIT